MVSSLITLKKFHISFQCISCWLWAISSCVKINIKSLLMSKKFSRNSIRQEQFSDKVSFIAVMEILFPLVIYQPSSVFIPCQTRYAPMTAATSNISTPLMNLFIITSTMRKRTKREKISGESRYIAIFCCDILFCYITSCHVINMTYPLRFFPEILPIRQLDVQS